MDKTVHVNVIGAGFAGLECALFLARHGVRVHLFNCKQKKSSCSDFCYCQNENLSQSDSRMGDQLRQEIKVIGSVLVEDEIHLHKQKDFNSDKIIEVWLEKAKKHPNIDYFDICVHEINLKEVNVIASGHRTEGRLYEWLKNEFGSLRCNNTYPIYPLVEGIDESVLKKKDECDKAFYLPLSYDEYISLCNKIIEERNKYVDYLKKRGQEVECVEEIVLKNKDALKNIVLKPVLLNCERPYAVLKLTGCKGKFLVHGFCSNLPVESQERILKSIKGMQNINLVREGSPQHNSYLNAPLIINEHWQSLRRENLFFAGNIAGVFGHIEGMASGLIVAHNVLSYIKGRKMPILPQKTCLWQLTSNLISQNPLNFSPISVNCDIIKEEDRKELFDNSISLLTKFEEDFNGRNV